MSENVLLEKEKFQRNLQCIRMLLNLTPEELGKRLDISRQTIMNLESAKAEMTVIQYFALKVTLNKVFREQTSKGLESIREMLSIPALCVGMVPILGAALVPTAIWGAFLAKSASRVHKQFVKEDKIEKIAQFNKDYGKGEDDKIKALQRALSLDDILSASPSDDMPARKNKAEQI